MGDVTETSRRYVLTGTAALGALVLSGCSRSHSMSAFTESGLAALKTDLQTRVAAGEAPGVVALLDRGGRTEVATAGAMALGGAPPMARDTIFRIASMTKLVTAAAVMMLIEDGKLRLDEPIDRLLPELANRRVLKRIDGALADTLPAVRAITVEDLLTFRLGWGILFAEPSTPILKAIADLGISGFGMPNPKQPFGVDEWLKRLGTLPLMAQPGERWLYTTGSDVQGALVQRASGQPFDDFVRKRILEPLGMKDTGFGVAPDKLDRLCTGYVPENGKLTLFDAPGKASRYAHRPQFPEGDSGLTSTIDDLLAFSRMLLAGGIHDGKRLLSAASVRAMTTNHLTPAQKADGKEILMGHGWGYGMSVITESAGDELPTGVFGWSGGFGTSWFMDRDKGLTAILLTQRVFDGPDPPAIHKAFWTNAWGALAKG